MRQASHLRNTRPTGQWSDPCKAAADLFELLQSLDHDAAEQWQSSHHTEQPQTGCRFEQLLGASLARQC